MLLGTKQIMRMLMMDMWITGRRGGRSRKTTHKGEEEANERKILALMMWYYRDLVLWISWATSYSPKKLDTTLFPLAASDWGTKYPVPNMAPPLPAEGEGPPT
jgi:hypothetical protein